MFADRVRVFVTIGIASAIGISMLAREVVARVESNVAETPTLTLPTEAEAINVSIHQRRHTGIVVDPKVIARLARFGVRGIVPHERFMCSLPAQHVVVAGVEIDVEVDHEEARMRQLEAEHDAR
jgi:hypothetical protein